MRALVWVGAIAVAAVMLVAGIAVSGMLDGLLGNHTPEYQEQALWDDISIDGMYRNISYENDPILLDNPTYYNQSGVNSQVLTDYYFSVSAPITDYGTQWFKSNLVPYSNQVYDQGQYRLNVSAPRFIIEITNPSGISPEDLNLSTDSDQHLYGGSVYPASYGTTPSSVKLIRVDDNTIRGILKGQPRQYAQANFGVGKQYVLQEWINDEYLRAVANCGIYFLKDGHYTISAYLASFDYANGTVDRNQAPGVMFSPIGTKDFKVVSSNVPLDKTEPFVEIALEKYKQFGPGLYPYTQSYFGEPSSGVVNTWVGGRADDTRIGVMIYFVGLANDEVYVNASYGDGEPQWTNLYNDGDDGCFGMFITDQGNIEGDKGWTWFYEDSGSLAYYNISISITTYVLGTHDVKIYAYDQDTGIRISDILLTNYTVYGTNDYSGYSLFETQMTTDLQYTFIPGQTYNFTFEDTCKYSKYQGLVRSAFQIPFAERVWLVNDDGSKTELFLGDGAYGSRYSFTWLYEGEKTTHTVHIMAQMGSSGGGTVKGFYWIEDISTGSNISHTGGIGEPGVIIEMRSAW